MAEGNGRRKPGRPRKVEPTSLTEVSQNETESTSVSGMTADTKFDEMDRLRGVHENADKAWCNFTPSEIERIKSCDEVYLVTKNTERLEDGTKDKQVHQCAWLKEVV